MITFRYRSCYIHENFTTGEIRVQDMHYRLYNVKSVHAAKILIAKLTKGM